tara:strand:+ start:1116 stop:1439 length:324 start_codon:yes stop_codon:yes gene_type:complete
VATNTNTVWSKEDPRSRISRLTSQEEIWLNALKMSKMDVNTPFSSKQACESIAGVPLLGSNRPRKRVPNLTQFIFVMKKSGLYEEVVKMPVKSKSLKLWRIKTEESK